MAQPSKRANEGSEPPTVSTLARLAEQSQLDFELDFFAGVLERHGGYVDVLRAHGNNLTLKGRYPEGLEIDKRLIQLRPTDALAHYNLACSFALLKKPDLALKTLRRAVELQDDLPYMEPPFWYFPVRQALGAALLEAGEVKKAEEVYREDLRQHPENGWSLYGLLQTLRIQGRSAEADAVEARFRDAWKYADFVPTRSAP